MFFTVAKFITRIFGLDISKVQRWMSFGLIALILLVVVVSGLWIKSCVSGRKARLDQANIQKINSENRKERQMELRKQIEENQDVVKTVDGRTEITNINVIEKNREIDAKVKAADAEIAKAKEQGRDVTQSELECLLLENCK